MDTTQSVYETFRRSSIVLSGTSTTNLRRGAVIDSLAILSGGRTQLADTVAKTRATLAQYGGTALKARGSTRRTSY